MIFITYHQKTFLLPLFVGMSTWFKAILKLLTPKFAVLFFKNSLFLKAKQVLIKSSTRFVVLSHKPWRHRMRLVKNQISQTILRLIRLYIESPLWMRTAIAIGLLFATASSSYVFIALLIIPQPILLWLRRIILQTLNKLGITHLANAIWKFCIPANVQRKWYMHRKWKMGRRQIIAARRLRNSIFSTKAFTSSNATGKENLTEEIPNSPRNDSNNNSYIDHKHKDTNDKY